MLASRRWVLSATAVTDPGADTRQPWTELGKFHKRAHNHRQGTIKESFRCRAPPQLGNVNFRVPFLSTTLIIQLGTARATRGRACNSELGGGY